MAFVLKEIAKCDQCGHEWITTGTPIRCSKCKSKAWNKNNTALVPAPKMQQIMEKAIEVVGIQIPVTERAYIPDRTLDEEVSQERKRKKAARHAELHSDSIEALGIMPEAFRRKLEEPPEDHHPCCKCTRCQVHFRGGR